MRYEYIDLDTPAGPGGGPAPLEVLLPGDELDGVVLDSAALVMACGDGRALVVRGTLEELDRFATELEIGVPGPPAPRAGKHH
jgi:hypothetical protein